MRQIVRIAVPWATLVFGIVVCNYAYAQAQRSVEDLQFESFLSEGMAAIRREDYRLAVQLLFEANSYRKDDLNAQALLAFALNRSGDHEAAIKQIEQLPETIRYDPDLQLILAASYASSGNTEQARTIYQSLAKSNRSDVRDVAERALERIDKTVATEFFLRPQGLSGFIILGPEYNSNIARDYDSGSQRLTDVSAGGVVGFLSADYDLPIGKRFFAGAGTLFNTNMYSNPGSQFDLQLFRGNLHAGVVGANWKSQIGYEHDYILVDYRNKFSSNRVTFSHVHVLAPRWITVLLSSISTDNYPDDGNQDATRYTIESSNTFLLPELKEGAYLRAGYAFVYNDTRKETIYKYYYNSLNLGLYCPLPWWSLYLDVEGGIELRPYKIPDPESRTDLSFDSTLAIGNRWSPAFGTEIYYSRYKIDSTVSVYSKTQNIVGIRAEYSF